jgi:hypothetical protein
MILDKYQKGRQLGELQRSKLAGDAGGQERGGRYFQTRFGAGLQLVG